MAGGGRLVAMAKEGQFLSDATIRRSLREAMTITLSLMIYRRFLGSSLEVEFMS